tara:strand:- start:43 stop:225 length:183 start_codon:yes stop_codon:yes gene_type:complete
MMSKEYRVRYHKNKYYPERYDEDLGWVGYKTYDDFLYFYTNEEAENHMKNNPNRLNINCD